MMRETPNPGKTTLDMNDLMARCLGNLEFAERVLNMFHQRCDEDLTELERAVAVGDIETVARIAHRLKGAAANSSVPGLRARAVEIEHAARERSLEGIPKSLQDLKEEFKRFTLEMSQLGSSHETFN
jgi:HPt (histidine-containing phosphotransfer) domain-containing protein